jgi:thymidylate synthase
MIKNFSYDWLCLLNEIFRRGVNVNPRGRQTLELPHKTIEVHMLRPVLVVPERKLSTKFLAGEAHWILSGDDRVETIAPYNNRIANYSDDGIRFFGAYGPKIHDQMDYVVDTLAKDQSSRQGVITIWRENPPETKDVPCTVAMVFSLRADGYDGLNLNTHVFMRSSDAWLGIPYDVFNFSMVSYVVAARLNRILKEPIWPSKLYLTAASSHLYRDDFDKVTECLSQLSLSNAESYRTRSATQSLFWDEDNLMCALSEIKNNPKDASHQWWLM